jgi:hypothetical protein
MKRPRFVDFYESGTHRSVPPLVAVGDFKDTATVKAEIEKQFADAKTAS